jgi:hypothetical protein
LWRGVAPNEPVLENCLKENVMLMGKYEQELERQNIRKEEKRAGEVF